MLGSLFAIPEVMADSPSDDADPETISTRIYDKCIEVVPIEGGRALIDCGDMEFGLVPHPPVVVGPMYAKEDGFTLALVDERNPGGIVYRITALDEEMGDTIISDWSVSRCRRFEGLRQSAWHRFEVFARNSSGVEAEPVVRWMYYPGLNAVNPTPADDP